MTPSKDDLQVDSVATGIGDDCEFIVSCQSLRFIIQLKRPVATDTTTIEGQLLHDLDQAHEHGDLAYDQCLEGLHEVAKSSYEKVILNIVTSQPENTAPLSLERFLHPPTFYLQLVTVDDHLKAIQHDNTRSLRYTHAPLWLVSEPYLDLGLPVVQASDVQFIEDILLQKVIKVHLHGKPLVFKSAFEGGAHELDREIRALHAINKARPSYPCLQVPQIRAIIVSGERILGFLADYLDSCKPLNSIDISAIPIQTRAKWCCQIQKSLEAVHALNLAWGDVKTGNVLIDSDQQAWLVDFAGSITTVRVDEKLKETITGDMQGLERVITFLEIGRQYISCTIYYRRVRTVNPIFAPVSAESEDIQTSQSGSTQDRRTTDKMYCNYRTGGVRSPNMPAEGGKGANLQEETNRDTCR